VQLGQAHCRPCSGGPGRRRRGTARLGAVGCLAGQRDGAVPGVDDGADGHGGGGVDGAEAVAAGRLDEDAGPATAAATTAWPCSGAGVSAGVVGTSVESEGAGGAGAGVAEAGATGADADGSGAGSAGRVRRGSVGRGARRSREAHRRRAGPPAPRR
jgi:hypothetical protein